MECIVEYKDINFRFDIIDFKFTYNFNATYDVNISCYDNGHINSKLMFITNDMIESPKKQESKLIINRDNFTNVLCNFIIRCVQTEINNNQNLLNINATFDYFLIEEDYEIRLRSEKIKNIVNKINNG
ncbi:MAG: hypothetical protein ACOC3V_02855 [bacterium]